jgi:hypothetical protein
MEVHLKALLELIFFTKPLNFGVEAHIEALAGVALSSHFSKFTGRLLSQLIWLLGDKFMSKVHP